jgi:hypothetical protein
MSGARANTSAIQRRTNNPIQQQPQMQQNRPNQQQPQMQQQQRSTNGNQPPQMVKRPQLSVSDAIALITIRLGQVETFIQSMPPVNQNENNNNNSDTFNKENMRIVDEAVFNSIVSRLDKLENSHNVSTSISNSVVSRLNNLETSDHEKNTHNVISNERLISFMERFDLIQNEISNLKDMILSLQTFSIQTNQKLVDVIFSKNENAVLLETNEETNEEINEEIITEKLDLKYFIKSENINP